MCKGLLYGRMRLCRWKLLFLGIIACCIGISANVYAGAVYTNPDTGFYIIIEDDAKLLTDAECEELAATMQKITEYGNVAFKTVSTSSSSTESLARNFYRQKFGSESGTLFLIDMDNRKIWIYSDGAVYQTITSAYADTITDNVYRYASGGNYFGCADEAFRQIYALLQGSRIAQPMKYISNALLAVILALLLNFGLISYYMRIRKPHGSEILDSIQRTFTYSKPIATFTHETKEYSPVSSGSGGSGGGGHSSGGGGGHSSGGGGGHSF